MRVRQAYRLVQGEVDRLPLTVVDGDVVRVQVGSIQTVQDRIQPPFDARQVSRLVCDDPRTTPGQRRHAQFQRPIRLLLPHHARLKTRRGAQHRHWQRGVQREVGVAERIGARFQVGVVGIERQHVDVPQRFSTLVRHRHADSDAVRKGRGGGQRQPQLPAAEQFKNGRSARQRPRFAIDHAHPFAASFDEVLPFARAGNVAHGALAEPGRQELVARELTGAQIVRGHGVAERSGGIQLQPVVEHEQACVRAGDGVVPMHHRVHHRLEHGAFAVLRHVAPPRRLARRDPPVAHHEAHGAANLRVEWAADVLRVKLPVAVHLLAFVAHRLDVGVREPVAGFLATEQDAAHRGARRSPRVRFDEPQLGEGDFRRLAGTGTRVASPQFGVQRVETGAGNRLRVRGRGVGQAAGLRQAANVVRVHLAFGVAASTVVAAGRPMHAVSRRNLHHKGATVATVGSRRPESVELQPRLDAVLANLLHQIHQRVELPRIERLRRSIIPHAQHQAAAARIGERGELVRKDIARRGGNLLPPKANFLQFEIAVFAEAHRAPKAFGINPHRYSPTRRFAPAPSRRATTPEPCASLPNAGSERHLRRLLGGRSSIGERRQRADGRASRF